MVADPPIAYYAVSTCRQNTWQSTWDIGINPKKAYRISKRQEPCPPVAESHLHGLQGCEMGAVLGSDPHLVAAESLDGQLLF
jgi:hypothetical protein